MKTNKLDAIEARVMAEARSLASRFRARKIKPSFFEERMRYLDNILNFIVSVRRFGGSQSVVR